MQHVLFGDFCDIHHAILVEVGDVVGAVGYVVAATDGQPQVDGIAEGIALDIYEAVAELHAVDRNLFPKTGGCSQRIGFFLEQIVHPSPQTVHPRLIIAAFGFLASVLYRHLADGLGAELCGAVNG